MDTVLAEAYPSVHIDPGLVVDSRLDLKIIDLLIADDYTSRLKSSQSRYLSTAISGDKLLRLFEQEARGDIDVLSVHELFSTLEQHLFTELAGGTPDLFRRHLQRTYVNLLINKSKPKDGPAPTGFARFFAGPDTYNSDVRSISRAHLQALSVKLARGSGDAMTKAHWADLALEIDRALAVPAAE